MHARKKAGVESEVNIQTECNISTRVVDRLQLEQLETLNDHINSKVVASQSLSMSQINIFGCQMVPIYRIANCSDLRDKSELSNSFDALIWFIVFSIQIAFLSCVGRARR